MELCLVKPRRDFFDKKMDEERTSYLSKAKHSEFTSIILIKKKKEIPLLTDGKHSFIYLHYPFCAFLSVVPFRKVLYKGTGRRGLLFQWAGWGFAVGWSNKTYK